MKEISQRIKEIKEALQRADYVLIGAGAGLSTAAGIEYGGKRFRDNFSEYIKKYGMTDMYTAGFYPFKTSEEKWGYWAKHIFTNSVGMKATQLYRKLYEVVKDMNHFVIITNVDDQFVKSGFSSENVFATQGSYNYFQCSRACHDRVYKNTDIILEMNENIDENLMIPSNLIPYCPRCGQKMDVNLRKDEYFVEDVHWHKQNDAYKKFINEAKHHKTVLLEFGVGYNTPGIIRFPFESMTSKISNWTLIRFNRNHFEVGVEYHKTLKLISPEELENYPLPNDFNERYIPVSEDIDIVLDELLK